MNRFETLFNLIGSGEVFADVGCDHGYISEMVIKNGKYKKVILSDISSKSLEKSVNLLSKYGDRVKFVVSDGFESYDEIPNEAIIAGMGGEEIIKILSGKILPDSLVLAPQKNTYKVRRFLLDNGYKILKDFTFYSQNKFYDAIKAVKGEDFYTPDELIFGRDNVKEKPEGFIKKVCFDIEVLNGIIADEKASKLSKETAKIKLIKLKEFIK